MIFLSTHSDYQLLYLVLPEQRKEKRKEAKTHPKTKFIPIFNGESNNCSFLGHGYVL